MMIYRKWSPDMDAALRDYHLVKGLSFTKCADHMSVHFSQVFTRGACIGRYSRLRIRKTESKWLTLQIGEKFYSTLPRQHLDNSYQWAKKRYGVVFTIKKSYAYNRNLFVCVRVK